MKALSHPCPGCPWRVDRAAADIPFFSLQKAENLAPTCPNSRNMGPEFGAPIFACHQSREGSDIPCAGWLAQVGECHPGVRLLVMQGDLSPEVLRARPGWPELHETFTQVIQKLRASA